jgi:hypothetical protein
MSFTARYPGRCNAGDDQIYVGQTIAEDDDGGFSHVRCLLIDDEPEPRPRPADQACPRCNLIHAGECF